jgi:hypothetical protein
VGIKRSFTIREGDRPKVFENRVLRRLSGSKREEATEVWRKGLENLCLYWRIILK